MRHAVRRLSAGSQGRRAQRCRGALAALVASGLGLACCAAMAAAPVPMSFEAAQARRQATSPVLGASSADVAAAEAQVETAARLNWPTVSLDAQWLHYQKTFDLSLVGALDQAQAAAGQLVPGIVGDLPGVPGELLELIQARLRQSLPEFFAALPDTVRIRGSQTTVRPVVSAILPLYTGGAITAGRAAAAANVGLVRALGAQTRDLEDVQLVQQYFGVVLAREAVRVALDTRDGFDLHLRNARLMEREGVLSTAQRLQVQVARDTAQRQYDRALLEYDTASRALARSLDEAAGVEPQSPLFVDRTPLGPLQGFIAQAQDSHPLLAQAAARRQLAQAGVELARSRYRPQVFAFGTYNLDRDSALPIEPDWAVGLALHYELLSTVDRRSTLSAANARASAADHDQAAARDTVADLVTRTYNLAELARRDFITLDSSLAAAEENLRVQDLGFREGEAPASALVDARNLLGTARVQRAAAAYEYVLSLASLLAASGRYDTFTRYQRSSEPVTGP